MNTPGDGRSGEPPKARLRSATEQDLPQILAFIRDLAEYERLAHEAVASAEDLRQALFPRPGELAEPCRPGAEVVIAELDGRPVGFALFFHNFSTFLARRGLYLEDLFVRPEARGHGVGRALLEHLARIAVERGCGRFEWSVLDWNEPAIRFYEALGARKMEDWRIFRVTGEALRELAAGDRG
jgi:GNAT superfamily N-acetyltransferase